MDREKVSIAGTQAPEAIASAPWVSTDALGDFGVALTRYHAGDAMGFIGLILAVITIAVAQSARSAAKASLARRDILEVAALLADLAGKIREVRDALALDDWSGLSRRIDGAAHVTTRINSSILRPEEAALAEEARTQLRAMQRATTGIKDAGKHSKLRRVQDEVLLALLDRTEVAHVMRLKDDYIP